MWSLLDLDTYYLEGLLEHFKSILVDAEKRAETECQTAPESVRKQDLFREDLAVAIEDARILRGMGHAALSTITAAAVENQLKLVLRVAGEPPPDRADWRCLACIFSGKTGLRLCQLAGYENVDLVRKLSNAFKHSDGYADEKLAQCIDKKLVEASSSRIIYEALDWKGIFRSAQDFIDDAVKELRPKVNKDRAKFFCR